LIVFCILKLAQRIALVSGETIFITSHNGQWSSRDGVVGSTSSEPNCELDAQNFTSSFGGSMPTEKQQTRRCEAVPII
jgi:hypothetical protein